MADADSSDLSSLSSLSPAPSDDESDVQLRQDKKGILKFFHKLPPGGKAKSAAAAKAPDALPKREPSPPHEFVLADNPDIAFIVLFRNRFAEAFNKNLATFGPQELEHDIVDPVPGERIEHFLCGLLKLLLNRQHDVKPGHYNRALEEAVQSHSSQWLPTWKESPLAGGKTFDSLVPTERLTLLRALILWAMSSSKVVHDLIDQYYKGKRNEDDSNVVKSVQPWGSDSDKRRYFLVEGVDDTAFRVYRESNPAGFINRTWWSVAGSIDEIRSLVEKLETKDGGPKAKKLAKRLNDEIPRFEATEEKRRRREYRQMQKDRFKRPDPGFSVYEGRTRGKRIKYTYSDDEDFLTDSTGYRRSARNAAPADSEPVTTASGRQIRAPNRLNGVNGATSTSTSVLGDEDVDVGEVPSVGPRGRPRRSAAVHHGTNGWAPKEDEYDSQAEENASEPDLGDDEEEDEHVPDDGDEEEDEEDEDGDAALDADDAELEQDARRSSVVKLAVSAVLDKQTGKWSKSGGGGGGGGRKLVRKADLALVDSDTTTPSNGDVDMSEAGQTSDETAESPVRTADEISVATKAPAVLDKGANGSTEAAPLTVVVKDGAKETRAGTPEKENSAPVNEVAVAQPAEANGPGN